MQWEQDGYTITTDPARLNMDKISNWLQNSYWAAGLSRELIERRRAGLGKWLVECAISHPDARTSLQLLRTRDAHGLYERYGFEKAEYMMRRPPANVGSQT
jgi:GNAT superfamily N-acetyltransferase